jgi:type IV pilus modification protein PilV
MKRRNNQGFTLIEVALSIVVVAIGIMAVFSLIGSGLESNRKAISESQAAIFANDVFNSLRSDTQQTNYMSNPTNWIGHWTDLKNKTTNITVAASTNWLGQYNVYADGTVYSMVFTNAPVHGGTALTNIVNGGLQYRLNVDGPTSYGGSSERVSVRLYVWDGIYAQADLNKALVFYSEFNNPGELK